MERIYSTLKNSILVNWKNAAEAEGLPREAYFPRIRIISNPDYSFGLLLNPHRYERFNQRVKANEQYDCHLCNSVERIKVEPVREIVPEGLRGYVVIMNKFPVLLGQCLAVSDGVGSEERSMYSTSNLDSLSEDMKLLLEFSRKTGFQAFHNSHGFGASIPNHEHWHLTNFGLAYDIAGSTYGFDAAEKAECKKDKNLMIMPDFPFAHLIFPETEIDKIPHFLRKLHERYSSDFDGSVPHSISQCLDGFLITISKNRENGGIGSGDVAGHIVLKKEEEFDSFTFEDCRAKLEERLFTKPELPVEDFV